MMKSINNTWETPLSAETIDEYSDQIRDFLLSLKLPQRDILRNTLAAEELLLNLREHRGDGVPVRLTIRKKLLSVFFSLEIRGEAENLFEDPEASLLGDSVLKTLGLAPEYSYEKQINRYMFRIKGRKHSPFFGLGIAVASAAVLGLLGTFLPGASLEALNTGLVTPLYDTFMRILCCISGPMVFLSVAWGIYGIGDVSTLRTLGKRILFSYIGTLYLGLTLMGLLFLPLFSLHYSGGGGGDSAFFSVFSMLLDIFPADLFSPFLDRNTLQIIFLGIVTGLAMLFLEEKTRVVAKFVEQINYIVQFLLELISRMVPAFIFLILLQLIWSDQISVVLKTGKLFAVTFAASILFAVWMLGQTALTKKVSPLLLCKKGFQTFLIALTTASSAAAFGTSMSACTKEYGIDERISSFGLPLGIVLFRPASSLSFLFALFFFSELYGIEASPGKIILMIFITGLVTMASPPIPGGALTIYTVLFTQFGIPTEALAIMLTCDVLFDFMNTGFNQFLIPFVMIRQADKMGMLDQETLHRSKPKMAKNH